jgi:hypothetical protein
MARIAQRRLFGWKEIDELGDLERLKLVLETIPDEAFARLLEAQRFRGRDDYPVRAMWNSLLAGVVFQHPSIESLRRELARNGMLLELCGFDPLKGPAAIPPVWVYSRFLKVILRHSKELGEMFRQLVGAIGEAVPDFGEELAMDGKQISSYGNPVSDETKKGTPDGRRDIDADWGVKSYSGVDAKGKAWEKVTSWFGYKLHLIIDSRYELPVDFRLTKASVAEQPVALEMLDELEERAPTVMERAKHLSADKGYDDRKIIIKAYDELDIAPIIDIRNLWKDGEKTKMVKGSTNVVYDYRGNVSCLCPKTLTPHAMCYGGYERDRESLKYLCPARAKGITCAGQAECKTGRQIRIPLSEDRRVFTPVARSSHTWTRLYDMRTAVERVNSRIDGAFMFEHHYIRGKEKMEARVTIAFIVMLAMALGRIRQNQPALVRSLVRPAC